MGKSASNSISESAHAGLTQRIEVAGRVRIDDAGAESQTRKNQDLNRCHEKYVVKKRINKLR